MKKAKVLYYYSYCDDYASLAQGNPLFSVEAYPVTEVLKLNGQLDYYIENYGHVKQYALDDEERGFIFDQLNRGSHYAYLWSYENNQEVMDRFKKYVIRAYKRKIRIAEDTLTCLNESIDMINKTMEAKDND